MARFSYIIVERPDSFGTFENFKAALLRVKELGYSGVEFNLTEPKGFDVDALRTYVDSIDLPVVSFLNGASYFSEGLCLCSPRAEVRQRAVERLKEYTEVAAQFGAVMVIGQMQGFLSDEPDRVTGEARIEECLRRVVEAAERNGATIVFEPVNHLQAGFNNLSADVQALVERIGSSNLKPMLDSFHMNIEEQSMTEPIFRVGHNLGHFHLCESNGSVLGSGHLAFKPILDSLNAINYSGYVSLKIYRRPWNVGAETSLPFLAQWGSQL